MAVTTTRDLPFKLVPPTELPPMDREKFATAFEIAQEAASRPAAPSDFRSRQIVFVDDETGEETSFALTPHPRNRALLAAKACFRDAPADFQIFALRFSAMAPILRSEGLRPWTEADPDDLNMLVHLAVLYAGAETPLEDDGYFDEKRFFSAVADIAAAMDA